MSTVGFHYTKIEAEKNSVNPPAKVNVNNKIILTEVKEAKINSGASKQKAIEFSFEYRVTYDQEYGSISIHGAILYVALPAKIKETLDKWKKDKMLPPDVLQEVYNPILERCSIESLFLARDMQLPSHIPLPKMKADIKGQKEKK